MFPVLPVIAGPDAPVPPGWWPVPPGWWLLGMVIFAGLLWMGYILLIRPLIAAIARRGWQPPVRIQARAALDELAHRRSLGAREAAYRLNEILRAALFDAGKGMGSGLGKKGNSSFSSERTSEAVPFLRESRPDPIPFWPFPVWDGVVEDQEAWQCFWQELEMRYQPVMPAGEEDIERWLALARGWIAHLPANDVEYGGVKHKKISRLFSLGRKTRTDTFPLL